MSGVNFYGAVRSRVSSRQGAIFIAPGDIPYFYSAGHSDSLQSFRIQKNMVVTVRLGRGNAKCPEGQKDLLGAVLHKATRPATRGAFCVLEPAGFFCCCRGRLIFTFLRLFQFYLTRREVSNENFRLFLLGGSAGRRGAVFFWRGGFLIFAGCPTLAGDAERRGLDGGMLRLKE